MHPGVESLVVRQKYIALIAFRISRLVHKVTESSRPAGSVAFSGLAQDYVLAIMSAPTGLGLGRARGRESGAGSDLGPLGAV